MFRLSAAVCLVLAAVASATQVLPCPGRSAQGLSESVTLIPCKKTPCKLKKGTDQHIQIEFTPDQPIEELKNHVTAALYGLDVPFLGVDGNSICEKLYTPNGEKTSCPLQPGTRYVYKDFFPILKVYPNLTLKVHWELVTGERDIICFEVPAKIIS